MRRWTKRLIACAALLLAAAPAWALSPFFIFFGSGSARISPAAGAILDNAVAFIRITDTREIEIEGYADRVGRDDANLALSRRRAEAVRDALLARGMSRHVVVRIVAHGETSLLMETADGVAEPQNQLAVIIPHRLCTDPSGTRLDTGECRTPLPD